MEKNSDSHKNNGTDSSTRRTDRVKYNRKAPLEEKIKVAKDGPKKGTNVKITKMKAPYSVDKILSDWDRMLLAKYLPGQIEAPYCAGQNILPAPTGTFKTSFSVSRCVNADTGIDGVPVALGTTTYTMMAYCPLVSTHLGSGTTSAFSTSTRLSGFQVVQGSTLTTPVLYQDGFNRTPRAYSCVELYGSDFTGFAACGAIWAGEINLSLLTPAANLVGAVYEGALTLSQIPTTGLSLSQLIQLSQKNHTGTRNFSLKGAVVNHNVVFESHADPSPSDATAYVDLSLETVHYMIFQTPAVNITTGSSTQFSFIGSVSGNYVFWPKATDPLANRLGRNTTQADRYLDRQVASISKESSTSWYDPLLKVGADAASMIVTGLASASGGPIAGALAGNVLGKVRSFFGEHASALSGAASGSVKSGLMSMDTSSVRKRVLKKNFKDESHNIVSKRMALYYLQRALEALGPCSTSAHNRLLSEMHNTISDMLDWWDKQDDYYDDIRSADVGAPLQADQPRASSSQKKERPLSEILQLVKDFEGDPDSFLRK